VITRARAIKLPLWAGTPVEIEQGGWPVVESFLPAADNCEVGLTDLSHRPKAVVQGGAVAGLGAPKPGDAVWNGTRIVGRLKPRHAVVFDLGGPIQPNWENAFYTDMTDAWVLLGLWGAGAVDVMQRLVTVDLKRSETGSPNFLATSSHGIRVQFVNLKTPSPGFLISCDRSHGQNLFDACLRTGSQFNLKITGVKAFDAWREGAGMARAH